MRLGNWCAFFAQRVHLEPWTELLNRWWPRLLPGAFAAASHGLIRTGHIVRALRDEVTAPRPEELGQVLGYWAARWQALPPWAGTWGVFGVAAALDELPMIGGSGGARTRLTELGQSTSWAPAYGRYGSSRSRLRCRRRWTNSSRSSAAGSFGFAAAERVGLLREHHCHTGRVQWCAVGPALLGGGTWVERWDPPRLPVRKGGISHR